MSTPSPTSPSPLSRLERLWDRLATFNSRLAHGAARGLTIAYVPALRAAAWVSPKAWKRRRALAAEFPARWQRVLDVLPIYLRLDEADRAELKQHIKVFIAEKHFEGCGGFVMFDEVKVTIAALASILLLRRDTDYYPNCSSILVYPAEYVVRSSTPGPGGIMFEGATMRAGESWHRAFGNASGGPVVLSWRSVLRGASGSADGHNVVLHEFAHQLDSESGAMDGLPALDTPAQIIPWARVMSGEYRALVQTLTLGAGDSPPLIDPYGATNPAEFFAVCTELFFEKPREMRDRHPALYARFVTFFKQDPAAWPGSAEYYY
jgi:Mlc titration factor MtfA (ptsG expression regulator)